MANLIVFKLYRINIVYGNGISCWLCGTARPGLCPVKRGNMLPRNSALHPRRRISTHTDTLRDAPANRELFCNLREADVLRDAWPRKYNVCIRRGTSYAISCRRGRPDA